MAGGAAYGTDSAGAHEALMAVLGGRNTAPWRGHYLRLSCILVLILITSCTNGYDGSMMNGLQTVDPWKVFFNYPSGGTLGLFNAIQNIGGLAGLPFAPYCSDRFGRRTGIMVGAWLMIIGVVIQSAAQNFGMFIGARFLIGFGLSFASIAAPILLTELAFPTHRAPATALYNTCWYLGSIIAAWTTYGTFPILSNWSWRIPSIVQGVPSVLQIIFIYTIPESPRWLVSRGREDEAHRVITKYHCNGNDQDPLIAFEFEEIRIALEQEAVARKTTWKSLFQGRGNMRRLRVIVALAFFSQWSGNGLVSYYLVLVLGGVGITNPKTQNLINGLLQIFNFACAIIAALSVDKVGRRFLFLASTSGMCAMFTVWTICSAIYKESYTSVDKNGVPIGANGPAGHAVVAFIFLYYMFYDIALTPLLVSYTVEILPYHIRTKGLMVMQYCVSASIVFNQYVNPIALDAINWRYYIVYCIWLACEFVYLYFTIIETKGKTGLLSLEEIAVLFDSPGSIRQINNRDQDVAILPDVPGTVVNPGPTAIDEKKTGDIGDVQHLA